MNNEIRKTNGTGQPSSYRGWMGSLTLVALLAIFIGFWQYSETLIGTIDRQANDLAETRERIRTLNRVLDIAQSQQALTYNLLAAGDSPYPAGKVLWNPLTRQAAIQINHLASSDRPYHLWVVADKKPVISQSFTISQRDTPSVWKVLDFGDGAPSAGSFIVTAGDSMEAFSVVLTSSAR